MPENEDQFIERALRERGILSPEQIDKAKEIHQKFGGAWSFKDVLLARHLVTEEQIASLGEEEGTLAEEPQAEAAGQEPDTLLLGEEEGAAEAGEAADEEATLITEEEPAAAAAEGAGDEEATLIGGDAPAGDEAATLITGEEPTGDEAGTLITGDEPTGDEAATLLTGDEPAGDEAATLLTGAEAPGAVEADDEMETLVSGEAGAGTLDDAETMLRVSESDDDAETLMAGERGTDFDTDLDDAATVVSEKKLSPEDEALEDEVFGQICIEMGWATDDQIEEARAKQSDRRKSGKPHRLGALLVDTGILETSQVTQALRSQKARILECPSCGARTSAGTSGPGTVCACSKCAAEMTVPDTPPEVTAIHVKEYLEQKSRGPISVSSVDGEVETGGALQLIGSTIGGCRIVKKLGEGGMGAVYMGEHEALRRKSAIKILPSTYANNPTLVARFFREARAAGKIRHANIVEVFNVGQDKGLHFIEMEFVEGKSLKDLMEDGQIELGECLRIIKDTATGLHAAHTSDVIHRDIKPDNIMLTHEGGVIKIADFGLARSVEGESMDLTKTGQIMGTPTYISPEQADAQKTDQRTDIYSLGATFYHMATNEKPFTGESPMVILLKHINEEPIPPTEYNPDLPNSVSMIIDKMMAKRLDQRYQTMEEVIKDIDAFQGGATISYKIKKKKKVPVKRIIAATVLFFVAVVIGLLQYAKYREAEIPPEQREAKTLYDEAMMIWRDGEGDPNAALDKVIEALAVFPLDAASELKVELEAERTYRLEFQTGLKAYGKNWTEAAQAFERAKAAKSTEEVDEKLAIARYEEAMVIAEGLVDTEQWQPAINKYIDARKMATTDEQKKRADGARKFAEKSLRKANFETYLNNANVALSKGDITGAEEGLVEASKLFEKDDRVQDLEARIIERKKTIRFEKEFRENFRQGTEKLGNHEFASAISFFEEATRILRETPALQEPLAEEAADLEKKLNSANYGQKMEDGKAAERSGKKWNAIGDYKAALAYGTPPEQKNTQREIYRLAMEIATVAWERKDTDEADRAINEALVAKPDDPEATALRQEVKRLTVTPEGMVYIPGGEFIAGTDHKTEKRDNPRRKVVVAPFYMDLHEVTNRDYKRFVDAGGYKDESLWDEEGWAQREKFRTADRLGYGPRSWPTGDGYNPNQDDYPVVGISWYEARAYAKWADKRLPTDEEWEYAAGWDPEAEEKLDFPWGNDWDAGKGNFRSQREAVPVFSFQETDKSPWGCRNMGGNASEWTNSAEGKPGIHGGSFKARGLEAKARITLVKRPVARARPPDGGFRCARDAK